jgi:hypothetical protein
MLVERTTKPGTAGVIAGRVVGALTVLLTVAILLTHQEGFYRAVRAVLAGFESDFDVPVWVLFWADVGFVALSRYVFCYVLGSLLGVGYEWLDRPGVAFLAVVVVLIGIVDGVYGALSAGSHLIGAGFFLAWLVYVPVFVWMLEEDSEAQSGPQWTGDR